MLSSLLNIPETILLGQDNRSKAHRKRKRGKFRDFSDLTGVREKILLLCLSELFRPLTCQCQSQMLILLILQMVFLCLPFHFREHSLRLVRQSWLTSRISQFVFLSNWIELSDFSIPKFLSLPFHLHVMYHFGRSKRRGKIDRFTDGCREISLVLLRNGIVILLTLDINKSHYSKGKPRIIHLFPLLDNNNKVT